jgi:hypothetical protein
MSHVAEGGTDVDPDDFGNPDKSSYFLESVLGSPDESDAQSIIEPGSGGTQQAHTVDSERAFASTPTIGSASKPFSSQIPPYIHWSQRDFANEYLTRIGMTNAVPDLLCLSIARHIVDHGVDPPSTIEINNLPMTRNDCSVTCVVLSWWFAQELAKYMDRDREIPLSVFDAGTHGRWILDCGHQSFRLLPDGVAKLIILQLFHTAKIVSQKVLRDFPDIPRATWDQLVDQARENNVFSIPS